jgi:hypothetical protein
VPGLDTDFASRGHQVDGRFVQDGAAGTR